MINHFLSYFNEHTFMICFSISVCVILLLLAYIEHLCRSFKHWSDKEMDDEEMVDNE